MKSYLIFFVLLFCCCTGFTQNETAKDSTDLYKKIEDYSEKRRFTRTIYKWVFRPSKTKPNYDYREKYQPDYRSFEGKIVRKIIIKTHDPFGYSINDTTSAPSRWYENTGNALHVKSKDPAVRNFLLFKENDRLDLLLMEETARLLRSQNYIRDAKIYPKALAHTADSVDVVITSLDSWSLVPKGRISSRKMNVELIEKNFVGLGHQANVGYSKRFEDGNSGFEALYSVPNFKNTFISATGLYWIDYDNYFQKSISIDRTFYSPFTRWAGGVFLEERSVGRPFLNDSSQFEIQDFRYIAQEYWSGHSFRLFAGDSERERTTNLVVSAGGLLVNYRKTPLETFDPHGFFTRELNLLGTVGITSRQYIKDYYIFQDGPTEDVPVGIIYSLTGGIQRKNHRTRPYAGGRVGYGNYFRMGFISGNFEAGTFFDKGKTEQMAFSLQLNYFSNLIHLGNDWRLRQFVKPQVIIGINRVDTPADQLSLNKDPYYTGTGGKVFENINIGSLPGFESHIYGNNKYVLEIQTQAYSPWTWLGFRINPYVNLGLGMITDKNNSPGSNKLYSSFGIGCILRNDYLVFESFQFSLAFYPSMPGAGTNIFKSNAFESDDFGFQDFQITKPRTAFYN